MSILIQFPKDILEIFHSLQYEYEYLSDLIIRTYSINNCLHKDVSIKEILARFVIDEGIKNKEWKKKVYLGISKLTNGNDFLFSTYSFELRNESDKKEFLYLIVIGLLITLKIIEKESFQMHLNYI